MINANNILKTKGTKRKFTRNEKKTLKLLLENAKISDSMIASKLKISSQAVGKIRRKLEKTVIDSYTINLNYEKLGIRTFSISIVKLTLDGLEKGEKEIEQKFLEDPHIIHAYRLPRGDSVYVLLCGFKDMEELDLFFSSIKKKKELHKYIENKELFVFSHNSLIKSNPSQLFSKKIDESGAE
jgi:DNA-binding Lrp family transcriptional regulator